MMDAVTAARAVGGTLRGENVWFEGVGTDSRTIRAGELFVALTGERFDGHDYIERAVQRGAVAAAGRRRSGRIAIRQPDRCRRSPARAGRARRVLAPTLHAAGRRHRRQQWQDHGEGNDRRDPARQSR